MACGALLLLLALQLSLPGRTELPADEGLAPRRVRDPVAAPIPAYPVLSTNNVFSPDRSSGAAVSVASAPIDQCSAVGLVTIGHAALALVEGPGAPAKLVRAGDRVCGWRLSHIQDNTLYLSNAGQRRTLVVGAPPAASATPASTPEGAETTP